MKEFTEQQILRRAVKGGRELSESEVLMFAEDWARRRAKTVACAVLAKRGVSLHRDLRSYLKSERESVLLREWCQNHAAQYDENRGKWIALNA